MRPVLLLFCGVLAACAQFVAPTRVPPTESGNGLVGLVISSEIPFTSITFWRDGERQNDIRVNRFQGGSQLYIFEAPTGIYCLNEVYGRYHTESSALTEYTVSAKRESALCFRLDAGKFGFGGHLYLPIVNPDTEEKERLYFVNLAGIRLFNNDRVFRELLEDQQPSPAERYSGTRFATGTAASLGLPGDEK